ncbi:O-antigen ligase family protein [Acetohalobium arabaticum]|uniref:O-antigen ligase family protein n=1 Tax=Acetohalobium arabaticum TaxID=28187 RepID=UPI001FE0D478|nr:O-antigen ligase family protein [Acetohalobium arabaticum]
MDKAVVVNYLDKFIIGSLMLMMFSSAISIAGSSIGLGLAFIGWIIKLIITREIDFSGNPLNKPIGIFLLAMLISFIGSYDLAESLDGLEDFLLVFILYYMVIDNVSDLKTVKKLFGMGLISIAISSTYGLFWQHYYLGVRRVNADFMALDFGALLLIYLLFVVSYLLFGSVNLQGKVKYIVLSPLIALTLIYNKTRGAWLGFAGATFLTFWVKSKKWIPIFLVIILVVVSFAPQQIQNRIKSIVDLEDNKSNLGRLALWKGSLLMFEDHPVNGIGLGNFTDVYKKDYKQPNTASMAHAHNNFLNFLAETGIVGLAGFIYLLYSILKYLYINYLNLKQGYYRLFVLATSSSVVGVWIIQGVTETNFPKSVVSRTLWFLIALSVVIIKLLKEQKDIKI